MSRFQLQAPGSGVPGSLKVMKNNTDDPLTTPNTDYGKFLFNSETTNIGYITGVHSFAYGSFSTSGNQYWPDGSTSANAKAFLWDTVPYPEAYFSIDRLYGTPPYTFRPIIETRTRRANGRFSAGLSRYQSYDGVSNSGAHNTWPGYTSSRIETTVPISGGWSPGGWLYRVIRTNIDTDSGTDFITTVWELPAEPGVAIGTPTATPVAGQENFRFSPTVLRVARPGFDVATATGRQVILDNTRNYAKVLRAGVISSLAPGANTTIVSPVPIPATAYLDWNWYFTGETNMWPPATAGQVAEDVENGIEYSISGSTVTIYNVGNETLTITYMLCADDDDFTPSTGGTAWLRKIGDDWQIKKQGSSDSSPKLRDILLDTRFSYIPIIAEGTILSADCTESATSSRYGNKAKTISFTNTGFTPFVKMCVKRQNSAGTVFTYTPPQSRMLVYYGSSGLNWTQGNAGTVALITNTSVKFHMATGGNTWINPSNPNSGLRDSSDDPLGIRYYIFGIPTL